MKVFLCLFSLYILVLAGIPCRADDDCCIEEIGANAPTKKNHDFPQPCSPFFACGTCHGFVVPNFNITVPAKQPEPSTQPVVYKGQPLPDFHASIWQPPRTV
jgi:hypothetical protein